MKFVRIFVILLLVITISVPLVSCKEKATVTISEPEVTTGGQVVFWGWGNDKYFKNYYDQFAVDESDFELQHDVKVVDFQNLVASIAANNPPDLVYMQSDYFNQMAYSNLLMDMKPLIEQDKANFDLSKYNQSIIEGGTRDGKLLYIGDSSGKALYWNKGHFSEANLDPEKPPKTWSEMLSYAKANCKYDSTGALDRIGFWDGLTLERIFYNSYQKDWFSTDGTIVTINTAESKKSFAFAQSIPEKEFGGRDKIPMQKTWDWMTADTLSMFVNETNVVPGQLSQLDSSWGMTYFPLPDDFKGENKFATSASYGFFIPKNAKNAIGGWTFFRWYTTNGIVLGEKIKYQQRPERFLPYVNNYKPSSDEVDAQFTSKIKDPEVISLINSRNELMKTAWPLSQPISKSVFDDVYNQYMDQVLDGSLPINDALDQMQKTMDQKMSDWLKDQAK